MTATVQFIPDFRRRISRPENRIDKNVRCPVCSSRATKFSRDSNCHLYGTIQNSTRLPKVHRVEKPTAPREKRGVCAGDSATTWSFPRRPSHWTGNVNHLSFPLTVCRCLFFFVGARCQSTHAPMQMSEALSTSPSTK